MKSNNWIAEAVEHKGSLHKALGVPKKKKIGSKKIKAAEHSKSPSVRKKAHLAETLSKLRKHK